MSEFNRCILGDCRDVMRQLIADGVRVQTIVTSPPYFGLRSYDENAVKIDPRLTPQKQAWLISELATRGIHART